MIKTLSLFSIAAMTLASHNDLPDMAIGDAMPMPDHAMMDVSGKEMDLANLMKPKGLAVVFSCNTCPFVIGGKDSEGWEGRYPELAIFCMKNDIGFVLVNSNEAKRGAGDSYEDMKRHYKEKNYQAAYVLDTDHALADAFGARTTPHVYLFNSDKKLVYKGAIDDNVGSAEHAEKHYLKDAVTALSTGRAIDPATTRNIGCSIKRIAHEH